MTPRNHCLVCHGAEAGEHSRAKHRKEQHSLCPNCLKLGFSSPAEYDPIEARKRINKRYWQTPKGRENNRRALKKFAQTDKGKAGRRKYWASKKGKATRHRARVKKVLSALQITCACGCLLLLPQFHLGPWSAFIPGHKRRPRRIMDGLLLQMCPLCQEWKELRPAHCYCYDCEPAVENIKRFGLPISEFRRDMGKEAATEFFRSETRRVRLMRTARETRRRIRNARQNQM